MIKISDSTRMRLFFILALLTLYASLSYGQTDYGAYASKYNNISNTGMYVLGSWAIANIATGAIGWAKYSGEKMYFNQMNLFWNVINISIAGFALYSSHNTDYTAVTLQEILARQVKTENLFLINSAIDVGYIGAGLLLKHLSSDSVNRSDMLRGYGNSVILQGSFLLVFDAVMFTVLRTVRNGFLENIDLAFSPASFKLFITLPV